jgi:hypothetical protein
VDGSTIVSQGPVRPLTAYTSFVQANRNKVLASDPDKSFSDVAKLIGAMWQALSAEERAPCVQL